MELLERLQGASLLEEIKAFEREYGMKLYKVKGFFKKIARWVSIYASFPHLWIAMIITGLSIVALLISLYLNAHGDPFWSSVFSNIFAGFLTGMILCLISGVKQISIAQLMSKKYFLEELAAKIKQYYEAYNELRSMTFTWFDGTTEIFDFIYDTGSFANWVNDYILQATFDETLAFKPVDYCKKNLNYDALSLVDAYQELHDKLYLIDIECPSKKEILQYFEAVDKSLRGLNSGVYRSIKEIDIRLEAINRSII